MCISQLLRAGPLAAAILLLPICLRAVAQLWWSQALAAASCGITERDGAFITIAGAAADMLGCDVTLV
jgi:hypothetical protein